MIGRLKGKLVSCESGIAVVDVGGVGFEVNVDAQTALDLGMPGDNVVLVIRTVVREDAITLFGFFDDTTRLVFDLLRNVTGIGPKMALAIMGGLPVHVMVQAVREKDIRLLATISGVGKKTAERLVMELGERFMSLPITAPAVSGQVAPTLVSDLRSALANLGYNPRDVDAAIRTLDPVEPDADLESMVMAALGWLSSR
ncbi:MAG TPA: Holliday junction branch migration protein RuvA [Myxococcota bacterium]|nr:Holliday junction branch migration protein RuvA [Myxococcota bacterium]HOC98837.1 Holliday junction branch migration protein RuvA [Myxococcota bacterium]HPV04441.1 Holliday junction branch migration protein RuvA [Myxococcota bacterium]